MHEEMGTNMNFKGFGNDLAVNFSLFRQPSVYSLTFDEFQTTLGKEFGSMNMEELLKSIWSAEETQNRASIPDNSTNIAGQAGGNGNQGGLLQRQGSLTLPRTISLKTVDEVWKDIAKDYKDSGSSISVPMAEILREPTLGEITLEEFLVRAGAVREDNGVNSSTGFGVGPGVEIDFQQQNQVAEDQPSVLPLNVNRDAQLASSGVVGFVDTKINGGLAHSANSTASLSSDGLNSNGDTPFVSPVPFLLNGGLQGRKGNTTMEKVIERRQKRMIKNRESAARSRARKQAYTMELEQELARLKEENEELKKKQEQIIEMQKNQVLELRDAQYGAKKRRLTKTLSGPW